MKNENLNFNETQKLYLESFFDCVFESVANIQSVNNMTINTLSNEDICIHEVERSLKMLNSLINPLYQELVELSCDANYLTLDIKEKNISNGLWEQVDNSFKESLIKTKY